MLLLLHFAFAHDARGKDRFQLFPSPLSSCVKKIQRGGEMCDHIGLSRVGFVKFPCLIVGGLFNKNGNY